MRPLDVQVIGHELAVRWDDGTESYYRLDTLRRACPCASCRGEVDAMGRLHAAPQTPLTPAAFELERIVSVGGYALQPIWGDGHNTGIYAFDYLRRIPA